MKPTSVCIYRLLTFRLGAKKQSTTVATRRNIITRVADVGVMLLDGLSDLNTALAREIIHGGFCW